MAEKKPRIRKTETVRERSEKIEPEKKRRIKKAAGTAAKPIRSVASFGKREYHPIKLPDNRVGRFLTKRRRLIPSYFVESWKELRQVTWPGRRETLKMTLAVFVFAIVFGVVISITDYGLDKLFKEVLLD